MPTKIIMPQLGESVVEGTISRWLKQEGEAVAEMESLLEVSTDKVDSEIPSPAQGTVLKILVPEGDTVRAGTVIAWVGQPGEALPEPPGAGQTPAAHRPAAETIPNPASPPPQPLAAEAGHGNGQPAGQAAEPGPASPPPAAGRSRTLGFISPIVARLAQEHRIDLAQVPGTGEGGRITKKDVLAFVAQQANPPAEAAQPAPWETPGEGDLFRPTEMVFGAGKTEPVRVRSGPAAQPERAPAPELPGEGQILPLNPMRRKIAEHMLASKRTAPHVTTVMEANLRRVAAHYQVNREAFARDGVKLSYTAYFALAAAQALRAFPLVNSSWREEGLLLHPAVNLGLAVSLGDEGLIVPVIKNADGLSLLGLARAIGDLAGRARGRKLQPEEVQGGTFTLTNHGISGSLFATPVINQPQCAILGIGAIQKRVVVLEDAAGDSIAIRPMVYLSLTFDHRILDGASADGFLARVVALLENWP